MALFVVKTKVPPLKKLSIPRLELCGAIVLARLLRQVARISETPFSKVFDWTDSFVPLGWLQGNPRRLVAFVGNWITEKSEAIPVACWWHVKGTDNPAECASRGMFPAELVGNDVWRKGPEWLKENEDNWNKRVSFDEHPNLLDEHNVQKTLLPVIKSNLPLLEKISTYSHLVQVVAWIFRFIDNARKGNRKNT